MLAVLDNAVREYRERAGRTAREVAEAVGVHNSTIVLIENGRRNASDEIKAALAGYFGVPIRELFFERGADSKKAGEAS